LIEEKNGLLVHTSDDPVNKREFKNKKKNNILKKKRKKNIKF
jgi:hypothetical protein